MSEHGLQVCTPTLRSVGPIAFGPDDVLFVADNASAKIVAVDVADRGQDAGSEPFDLEDLDGRLASFLGCEVADLSIRDLAVHPRTHNVYLSVMRGAGDAALPLLLRVDGLDGSIVDLDLRDIPCAEVALEDAPTPDDERRDVQLGEGPDAETLEIQGRTLSILRLPIRSSTVTDLAYVDGTLLVAGMSNEEFSSTLRRIPFPFTGAAEASSLEIFHVSHGMWETAAPIRAFVPYEGGRSVLASYTCTPVVHFPLNDLVPGAKATGRTVAELGAMNQPLDMVSFQLGGEEFLLVANSNHGLIKIRCADIDAQEGLTEPQGPTGVPRDVEDLAGIVKLDNLNGEHVLALQRDDTGRRHLRSLKTASL